RMVITNNSAGAHVIKHFGEQGSFLFPVGISAEDYTPARFESIGDGEVRVSVENYSVVSFSPEDPERGMDRIWNVYSPLGRAEGFLSLIHNRETDGEDFNDERAFIFRADHLG